MGAKSVDNPATSLAATFYLKSKIVLATHIIYECTQLRFRTLGLAKSKNLTKTSVRRQNKEHKRAVPEIKSTELSENLELVYLKAD